MHRKTASILWVLMGLLLIAAPGQAEYKLIQGPAADDPMQTSIYQLANGLTVYLTVNREEPRFYAETAIRAGSVNDPDDLTGMAHYMEHMLFKGTSRIGTVDFEKEKVHLDKIEELYEQHFVETDSTKRKEIYAQINAEVQQASQYAIPGEIDRLFTAMGERGLNAGTSQEFIYYHVDLPANRLEQWAKVEAERFREPVFRLFQTELETVYEEMNMRYIDNKDRLIRNAVNRLLFKNHPYGRPIIGTVEDLKNPSIRRMYDFYNTYYVPNNMALILSGDIDVQKTIETIDAEFSGWESRKLPKPRKWKEKKIKSVERDTVYYPGEEFVLLAFRTIPSTHKDTEALQLFDMILDNAAAGLINLNLNQQQKVRQAGSYTSSHGLSNDYGAQHLWGIPKEGQSLKEVEQLLIEQIEQIKRGEFEEWLIPAIVTDFKKSLKQRLEGNGSRAGMLRSSFLAREKWDHSRRKIERMEKVTKKDVTKVAKKYFKDGYISGYRLDGPAEIPAVEKPELDKIDIDASRQSEFFQQIASIPYEEIEPAYIVPGRDFTKKEIRDGVDLYYSRNPLNDLFSFTISVDIGTLADNRMRVATELMDKSGTQRFSAEDLKKEWYKLGTDFSIGAGDQRTTISISGLDENFAASLALLVEFTGGPTADDATLADRIGIILKNREDAVKDHRTIHQALYRYNRFGDMAYYRRIIPNDKLQQLTKEELHGLISGLTGYEQTLSYTGSLSADQVLKTLADSYPLAEELQTPPPYHVMDIRRPEQTEIYFFDKEMAQAQVRIEFGDVTYSEFLTPAVTLYNEYFYGGMAGIVFQELREARALAYRVGALYFQGDRKADQNLMVGVIGTQADKTIDAVDAFVDLLDNLPVSPERFAAAQHALVSKYRTERLGFRQVLGSVRQWEKQEVPIDPRSWRFGEIQKADLDRVLQFHQEHIQNRPKLISIVGDRNKIDMESLARHGKIVELTIDDLFAF
jgi:predicted Zn-dependent peptidase